MPIDAVARDTSISILIEYYSEHTNEIGDFVSKILHILLSENKEIKCQAAEMEYAAVLAIHGNIEMAKNKMKPFIGKGFTKISSLFYKDKS